MAIGRLAVLLAFLDETDRFRLARGLHLSFDDGALGDKQYNYDGDEYAPDFDLFIWGWGGDVDPNFILSIMTTGSIENWSDCMWSNAEYDKLFLEQQATRFTHRVDQIPRSLLLRAPPLAFAIGHLRHLGQQPAVGPGTEPNRRPFR